MFAGVLKCIRLEIKNTTGVLKITTLGFQSPACNSIGIVEHSLNIFQSTVSSFQKCGDIEMGSIHNQVGD